jgi:Flp pilus assembly protein protease CpaA
MRNINFLHLLVVAPLLAYAAYCGIKGMKLPMWLAYVLALLAVLVALAHGYGLYMYYSDKA